MKFINDHCFSCHNRQTCQPWRKLTCCTWAETSCHRETQFFVWIHFLWVHFTLGLCMPTPGTTWLPLSEQQENQLLFRLAAQSWSPREHSYITMRKLKEASRRKVWLFLWGSRELKRLPYGSDRPLTLIKKVRRKPKMIFQGLGLLWSRDPLSTCKAPMVGDSTIVASSQLRVLQHHREAFQTRCG